MKSNLTIKPLLVKERARLNVAIGLEALRFAREVKLAQTESTPAGRTYRIGSITKAYSSRFAGLGLRSRITAKGNRRVIVGSKFYRASARGQAPANRTGGLLNATQAKQIAPGRWKIFNSKKYAGILDSPTGLDRPFFHSTFLRFRPGCVERLRAILRG